jgi:hypothetical protein
MLDVGMEGFLSPQDDLLCIWQVPKQDISSTFSGNARYCPKSIMGMINRFPVKGLARKHVQNVVNKYLGKEE